MHSRDSKILMKLALRTLLGHYGCPVADGKLEKILPNHVGEMDPRDSRLELKLHLGGPSDEPSSWRGLDMTSVLRLHFVVCLNWTLLQDARLARAARARHVA
ncbi:hypothetical protein F441_21662 [Phytophthora nicotianae CJ01A1]|nr:hypothetical protein F441_21662 [Phytophthora nicotianae CJ01A1]